MKTTAFDATLTIVGNERNNTFELSPAVTNTNAIAPQVQSVALATVTATQLIGAGTTDSHYSWLIIRPSSSNTMIWFLQGLTTDVGIQMHLTAPVILPIVPSLTNVSVFNNGAGTFYFTWELR